MAEEKVIKATPEERQVFLLNAGMTGLESKGRELLPKIENISKLRALVGINFLKTHFGDKYEEVDTKLRACRNYIAELTSYFSDIDDRVVNREDVTSQRFMKYREALAYVMDYLFFLDEIEVLLLDEAMERSLFGTKSLSIPSKYWGYLTSKMKGEPMDASMARFGGEPMSLGEFREKQESQNQEEEESDDRE